MNSTRSTVMASIILGKIFSIIGYAWTGFWMIGLIVGITQPSAFDPFLLYIMIILIMMSFGIIFIILGSKIKKMIRRFKTYVSLISIKHLTSLDLIANSTNRSVDFVRTDLQKMIDKKYFKDAYIDRDTNEIIIAHDLPAQPVQTYQFNNTIEMQSVTCAGCGAANVKPKGTASSCEYCGSPL